MKHRDRIMMALSHETPDRCPMAVSFTPEFAARLKADLQLKGQLPNHPDGSDNSYGLEEAIGQDMLLTSVGWGTSYYQAQEIYTDEWGITWRSVPYETPYGLGHYTEMVAHPLAEDLAIDRYQPPDPGRPELYAAADQVIRAYKDDYWIVGAVTTTIFECAWALRGYERLLMDLALNPGLAQRILEIPYQYHLTAAQKLAQMGVDMIWIGDDVGAQRAMVMSPAHWRTYLKPRLANFIATLKAVNPQIKVAYHSDGFIEPIIPELIEIGLDVLNPIQPACMDPAKLKRLYGRQLCFWGSLDEQHTLPFGSPAEVSAEVQLRLTTLGRQGGLIIGPSHNVQLDTPLDNFWAMVNTITGTACTK